MHLSARSKVCILRSVVTLVAIVGALLVTAVSHSMPVHAASVAETALYNGIPGTGVKISATRPSLANRIAHSNQGRTDPFPLLGPVSTPHAGVEVNDSGMVQGSAVEGSLLHNFNGLS